MEIQDRVEQIIKYSGLNKNAFSNHAGIQPQTLHHIISGRRTKPSFDVLERIALAFPQISILWLITGKGDMIETNVYKQMYGINVGEMSDTKIFSDIPNSVEKQIENLNGQIDISNARLLYHLSINDLNRKIVVEREKLKLTYDSYFLLRKIVDELKTSSTPLKAPSSWDAYVNVKESEMNEAINKIEDKKLKAIYLYLRLEQGIDIMQTATRIAIQFLNLHMKYENFNKELGV